MSPYKDVVNRHMFNYHNSNKSLCTCKKCGVTLGTYFAFTKHKTLNDCSELDDKTCGICLVRLKTKKKLARHMLENHQGEQGVSESEVVMMEAEKTPDDCIPSSIIQNFIDVS